MTIQQILLDMAKIYYVGDWAVLTGPVFAESPFNYEHKGLEIFNYGKWLKSALESDGKHEVESVPIWDPEIMKRSWMSMM